VKAAEWHASTQVSRSLLLLLLLLLLLPPPPPPPPPLLLLLLTQSPSAPPVPLFPCVTLHGAEWRMLCVLSVREPLRWYKM
jgi:hypothetical protein